MKKQILALSLALLLALSAGCGASGAAATAPTAAIAVAPEPTATPTPEPTPELKLFPWREHTLCAASVRDDGGISLGTTKPEGRFIEIILDCMDGYLVWDELTEYGTDFTLRDELGNDYTPVGSGMRGIEGESLNFRDLDSGKFAAMQPIFDIPAELALSELTLRVATEREGETILVALSDIPLFAEEEK